MVNHSKTIPPSLPEYGARKLGWGGGLIETMIFLLAMLIIILIFILLGHILVSNGISFGSGKTLIGSILSPSFWHM